MTYRIDRLDVINESCRLETETLRKEVRELTDEKNKLQLELSAARVEINYHLQSATKPSQDQVDTAKKSDDQFTEELIQKIELLTQEKSDLAQALEVALSASPPPPKEETEIIQKSDKDQQTEEEECGECMDKSGQISALEAQVEKLREEKLHWERRVDEVTGEAETQHEAALSALRSETQQLKKEANVRQQELEQLSQDMKLRTDELEAVKAELTQVEAAKAQDRQALLAQKESLSSELSECQERELNLKVEMGQNSEKLYAVEERCKSIEKERDDLKRRCKEFEAKIDVLSRSEQAAEKDASERLLQLEKALEEALVEREEILEAAEKEIQAQKTMAIETEQKMMDDFEWKLREIESEYREKIKNIEDEVDAKVKTAVDNIVRQKDEEFTRSSIKLRREMDEKIRQERTSIKEALETQNNAQRDKAADLFRIEKEREIRILQQSWEDEQTRLNREIHRMQRTIDALPNDIEAATRAIKIECDAKLQEERRKLAKADQKSMEEADKVRMEMAGHLRRVQAQCDEKIAEYEAKLEAAHGNRMSSMFQMKEEVEVEFTDRMEQLRDMYKHELEQQAERLEEEQRKSKELEENLRTSINEKQQEIDDLNTYYMQREEELETKINELLERLQNQTALAVKLQNELDEYEWYEEEEDPAALQRPASARSQHKSHSRPPSTKPLEQHKLASTTEEEDEKTATATAAHNNYVSMTSLYGTAQASTASEVSNADDNRDSSPYPPPRSKGQPPLAEEAFLPEERTSSSSPSPGPQPQQYTYANPLRFLYL